MNSSFVSTIFCRIDGKRVCKELKIKVLIVEDEPVILEIASNILKSADYEVFVASDSGEAFRIIEENEGRIDLLITDVMMQEMNGRDLAENILQICPDIKCLFVSGYSQEIVSRMMDGGLEWFLQKPFGRAKLLEKVREVIKA